MKSHFRPPPGNARLTRIRGLNRRGTMINNSGQTVQRESFEGQKLLLRFERDPTVKDFGSLPDIAAIPYIDDKSIRQIYIPSFIVWRHNGNVEIHEISFTSPNSNLQRRRQAAEQFCLEHEWLYIMHSDPRLLPAGAELANLLALRSYKASAYANPNVRETTLDYLEGRNIALFADLVDHGSEALNLAELYVVAAICHLIWHGDLTINWDKLFFRDGMPIRNTRVWCGAKENSSYE